MFCLFSPGGKLRLAEELAFCQARLHGAARRPPPHTMEGNRVNNGRPSLSLGRDWVPSLSHLYPWGKRTSADEQRENPQRPIFPLAGFLFFDLLEEDNLSLQLLEQPSKRRRLDQFS